MVEPTDSWTISIGQDGVDIVEEFESHFERVADERGETYSRAGRIKEAMALYQAVHEVARDLDETVDPDDIGPVQMRHWMRQAILDLDRREAERRARQ